MVAVTTKGIPASAGLAGAQGQLVMNFGADIPEFPGAGHQNFSVFGEFLANLDLMAAAIAVLHQIYGIAAQNAAVGRLCG